MHNNDANLLLNLSLTTALASRKNALRITSRAKTSHIGSCLSVIDILSVLFSIKFHDELRSQDEIILSKGHAAAALYSVLDHFNSLNADLGEFCNDDSQIYGHINHHASDLIPLSTGSLGHGLPFGLGIALGQRMNYTSARTYVVISDGELNEGTTWESAMIANHLDLSNLTVVIDRNRIQSLGFTEDTLRLEPLAAKWEAFGWNTIEVDGHDHESLLSLLLTDHKGPTCLIANTIKGKGVSFMEDSIEWHYKSANESDLNAAFLELDGLSG